MSIEKNQLRRLIKAVLAELASASGIESLFSDSAVELLMLTAAQESHCGMFIEQIQGPALGIFQMEPATYADIMMNYLKYRPALQHAVSGMASLGVTNILNLKGNILYQIALARVHYYRTGEKIPAADDVRGLAEYYKRHYNTVKGKATAEEAVKNYKMFA